MPPTALNRVRCRLDFVQAGVYHDGGLCRFRHLRRRPMDFLKPRLVFLLGTCAVVVGCRTNGGRTSGGGRYGGTSYGTTTKTGVLRRHTPAATSNRTAAMTT